MADEESCVRVAVRIRPQIPREVIDMCRICTTVTPGEPQVTLGTDKAFTYDYVFDTTTIQDEIYNTCVSRLVEGSLDGYNATVLAYGQTGSGKTYTMGTGFDVELDPLQSGIIPRAIKQLFSGISARIEKAKENEQQPPEFKIMAQFMELYNEEIIDLLEPSREAYGRGKTGIKIHEDAYGGIYVVGVTVKPISTPEDALQCLRLGALSRTTASTQMNAQSSRSHAIFTLLIKQQRLVKVEDGISEGESSDVGNEFETLTAKFHFVDLAGSERLKRTGATGERAKEGISINCGLLSLGNVISALGDKSRKASHVPYRDSKLTRLLQDSLGGNSQTLMIACVSPSDRDFMETLNTLNYANRARNIKNRVVVNQDKSSRTILILRQEIQQLQLELLEYKQGKRIVSEDGVESVNDMFHENIMLQSELNNLRTRVKAMQETIDILSNKNTQLLAERAVGSWISEGKDGDLTEVIQGYLKEIEELRAKLLESEATCQQLRKNRTPSKMSLSSHFPLTRHLDLSPHDDSTVEQILSQAKRNLSKDYELLAKSKSNDETNKVLQKNGNNEEDSESDSETRENNDGDGSDSSSTDSEEKEAENEQYGLELAELTSEINIKEKLIEELELSQKRLRTMRQHYEDKLMQLQERIRATQDERDKVLASFSGQSKEPTEKVKKVRDEYERKLGDMQKELKRLQCAKKEHARLLQTQTQHENQLRSLRNDLADMKKTKVKLLSKMKEESARHKEAEVRRNREIAQLRKATRKHENQIRSLEAEKRMKDAVLRRKQEEVTALRKMNRGSLSNKAAGRVTRKNGVQLTFSPKEAKHKWQRLEKTINQNAINKQAVAVMEKDMERNIQERESLGRSLEDLIRRRDHAISCGETTAVLDFDEQIENIKVNLDYIQDSIREAQQSIMQIEESKEGLEGPDINVVIQDLNNIVEARYLIQKLYTMTINQGYAAAQKELSLKELDAQLKEKIQESTMQEQLLQHVLRTHDLDLYTSITGKSEASVISGNSSETSTRSNSPTDRTSDKANLRPSKIRHKTKNFEELLYPSNAMVCSTSDVPSAEDQSDLLQTNKAIFRVPSAPGSLKNMVTKTDPPKPSPVGPRKVYDRQDSTSPRPSRRTYAILPSNLLGKPGSMEQGLDGSPPNSPPTYRRTTSREENVFSRLTSGTTTSSDQQIGEGVISIYQGKVNAKAPLVCTHIAEGHSRAVLSVYATDDLLFSASKDRTVKIWDLQTGVERQSLRGHPNNVVVVKYHEESRLVFSVSSAYVKVWDMRDRGAKCIKTFCSSGITSEGSIVQQTPSRLIQCPPGETQINDIALNHCGTILYTASGDRVRVWDLRKYESVGKLSGGHQAAVMCLAVGKMTEDEDIVVTGSKDHYIKVFEVNRNSSNIFQPKVNLNPPHYDGIQALAIRGDVLFSGSRDMCIKKWDLSKQELIQSLNGAHKDWVCGLNFMPGGQILLSVCRAGMIKLWSADSCNLLGEMKAHSSPINAVTTNSSHIFTAASDNTIGLWRRRSRYDISPDV